MAIHLKKVGFESEVEIQRLLDLAPQYHLNVEGVEKVEGSARALLEALPPECSPHQKHVLLVYQEEMPIGVVDLIIGYPQKDVAFLGLQLLAQEFQGKGLGKETFQKVEQYAQNQGAQVIQLGVVDLNPVEDFWRKMGLQRNGREKEHVGAKVKGRTYVLEKKIKPKL